MKSLRNAVSLALIVAAAIVALVCLERSTPTAHAQQDPTTISNQWTGQVTIFQGTNGARWLYLPDGTYVSLPLLTNGNNLITGLNLNISGSGTISTLISSGGTITGGLLTNTTLEPVTIYLPGSNGVPTAARVFIAKGGTNIVIISGTTTSTMLSAAGTIVGQ